MNSKQLMMLKVYYKAIFQKIKIFGGKMNKFKIIILIIIFAIGGNIVIAGQAQCLATGDYYNVMKDSKVNYNIKITEGNLPISQDRFAEYLYQQKEKHKKNPRVLTDKSGNKIVVSFVFKEKAKQFLKKANKLKKNKDYYNAIKIYELALNSDSFIYPALIGKGNCYLRLGNIKKAIENFKKAAKVNSNDYYCHLMLGRGYVKAGNLKLGLNSYINALALKPRDKKILKALKVLEKKKFIIMPDISLNPLAYISREGKKINIFFSKNSEQGIWYPYAITRAVWMFEPDYKNEGKNLKWFFKPEKCALENTLFYYFNQMNMKKLLPMPKIDRIVKIQDAQLLEEYVYYEAGSRIYPDIILTQTTEFKRKFKSFISRFVVVKR